MKNLTRIAVTVQVAQNVPTINSKNRKNLFNLVSFFLRGVIKNSEQKIELRLFRQL